MSYLKAISKKYKFIIILLEAIILGVAAYFVDKSDVPSGWVHNHLQLSKYIGIGLIVVIVLVFLIGKMWRLIVNKNVSYFDKLLWLGLLTEIAGVYDVAYFGNPWKKYLYVVLGINTILVIIRFYCYKEKLSKK